MAKSITLNRHELVWQTRTNTWTEKDYNQLVAYYKGFIGKEDEGNWTKGNAQKGEFLSQYTWDDVLNYWNVDYENEPFIEINNGDWSYREYLTEIVREAMREDNYDCDVTDENYADDYEEDFDIDDSEESEAENDDE